MMRRALERAPLLKPQIEDIPFDGGLVGTTGYDVVRFFERLPPNHAELNGLPQAVYVAPESLLVFDHLTRRVALLHSGSERDRQALRASVVNALRGGLDAAQRGTKFGAAAASMTQEEHSAAVQKGKAHIKAGDIYQIVLSVRFSGRTDLDPFQVYRGLRLLNPSPYMYYLELGALRVAGSSPEALVRLSGRTASLRPIAGTRPRGLDARARRGARDRAARGSEGERRARDARRPRAQRPGPRREPRARCTSIRTARSSAIAT